MSDRILSAFTSGEGELYGILLAQMQSGKSGTYLHLAMDAIYRGFFSNAYIICGSRDTALRDQTKSALEDAIESFCDKKATSFTDGMALMKKLKKSIQVYWNQDLKDVDVCDNSIIINDESHTAQSKCNIPYKEFWKKSGLSACLHGDFTELRNRNIRILSVSATSFSECVENQKIVLGMDIQGDIQLSKKNVFIMDPGPTYTGVAEFLSNGNIIFASEPINDKTNGDHLRAVLMDEKYSRKYCIVRTARASLDADLVRDIANSAGVEYKPVHSDKIIDSLKFLEDEPEYTTLVHICGIARMGQELDKTHIGFVYEQSKNPAIDTLLQGLLGRMCGHNANPNVDIFVSEARKKEVEQYASAVKLSAKECIAAFAKIRPALNVKASGGRKHTCGNTHKDKSGGFWKKMVTIKFPYRLLNMSSTNKITHKDLYNLFIQHPELIEDNPDKQFIMGELEFIHHSKHISRLNLSNPSYKKNNLDEVYSKKIRDFQFGGNLNTVSYSETPNVIPFYILIDEKEKKDVYFTGFAPETNMTEELWTSQIGMNTTLKKCNFNPAHVAVTEAGRKIPNVNGGQLIVFPKETAENDVTFYDELKKAVQRSMVDKQIQKEIMSVYCDGTKEFKGIRLCKRVFTQDKIDAIKKKIEEEFTIKLKFTKTRGRQPTGYFQYSSISW